MDEREYIERETAKRDIRRLIQDPWNHQAAPASWADAYRQMIDILDGEPAADVRPVKRGEWQEREVLKIKDTNIDELQSAFCPVCERYHTTPYMYYFNDYNFCPNCGAEMRPEVHDGV